jgi:hypothetical protein
MRARLILAVGHALIKASLSDPSLSPYKLLAILNFFSRVSLLSVLDHHRPLAICISEIFVEEKGYSAEIIIYISISISIYLLSTKVININNKKNIKVPYTLQQYNQAIRF